MEGPHGSGGYQPPEAMAWLWGFLWGFVLGFGAATAIWLLK